VAQRLILLIIACFELPAIFLLRLAIGLCNLLAYNGKRQDRPCDNALPLAIAASADGARDRVGLAIDVPNFDRPLFSDLFPRLLLLEAVALLLAILGRDRGPAVVPGLSFDLIIGIS